MKKPSSMSVKRAKISSVNFWSKPKKNVWMLMSVCNINGWLEITATKLWRLLETDFSLFEKRSGKNMPTGTSLYCPLAGWANSRLWENCKLRSTGCKKFWSTGSALHPGLSSNPNQLLLWKVMFIYFWRIFAFFLCTWGFTGYLWTILDNGKTWKLKKVQFRENQSAPSRILKSIRMYQIKNIEYKIFIF